VNDPPRQSQSFLSFSFANKQPDFQAAPFCASDSQHCAFDEWVIFHAEMLAHDERSSTRGEHAISRHFPIGKSRFPALEAL